jgi:hypothetical protein
LALSGCAIVGGVMGDYVYGEGEPGGTGESGGKGGEGGATGTAGGAGGTAGAGGGGPPPWASTVSASERATVTDIVAVDDDVVLVGWFEGVGLNIGEQPCTPACNSTGPDMFVARLAHDGAVVWIRSLGSASEDRLYSVTYQPSLDLVVVLGDCGASIDAGNQVTLGTVPGKPCLLQMEASTGVAVKALSFGGDVQDVALAAAYDGEHVWITGGTWEWAAFEPVNCSLSQTPLTAGLRDIFVLALNDDLSCHRRFGYLGDGHDSGLTIAPDGTGGVFVGAYFSGGELDLGSAGTFTPVGANDGMLFRLAEDGTLAAHLAIQGGGEDSVQGLATSAEDLWVAGSVSEGATLVQPQGMIGDSGFLMRLATDLTPQSAYVLGPNGVDPAASLVARAVATTRTAAVTVGDFGGPGRYLFPSGPLTGMGPRDGFALRLERNPVDAGVVHLRAPDATVGAVASTVAVTDGDAVIVGGSFDTAMDLPFTELACAANQGPCGFVASLRP